MNGRPEALLFTFIVFVVVVSAGVVGYGLSVSIVELNRPRPEPVYQTGQMVRLTVADEEAMVIGYWCPRGGDRCSYTLRLPSAKTVGGVGEHELEDSR